MMMRHNTRNILLLIIVSVIFFFLGNNLMSLTNPDEVFYVQTAKEMAQHKTWAVPYLFSRPNFEKPILTYWFLRLGFLMFGISGFSARFFPALFALIGVIAVYWMCYYAYKDEKKALLCSLVLASSGLYIGLARTVFTDMIFSVLIALSLASFFIGYSDRKKKAGSIILFFIFCACAVLTKGPLGIVIPLCTVLVFLIIQREVRFFLCRHTAWGFLVFLAIGLPWYVFMIQKFGVHFIQEFFYNDHLRRIIEAEHLVNDRWYFYPASMIVCMFPWSLYVAVSFFCLIKRLKAKKPAAIDVFLLVWIIVVFGVFQFAHSKLVSYVFPLFPALAILVGDYVYRGARTRQRVFYALSWALWGIFLVMSIGVLIAARQYPHFVPSLGVLCFYSLLYVMFVLGAAIFMLRRRLYRFLCLIAWYVPFLLMLVLSSDAVFDSYVSSKDACLRLRDQYAVTNTVLCSKFFVRGVRFFADYDVAVIDINGDNFFSPHPIAYLNTDAKISEFLLQQSTTYAILKKSAWKDIERIAQAHGWKAELLSVAGDEYVVVVSVKNEEVRS